MADPYRKNPDFIFRRIADESILVPVSDSVADMESIYVFNEVAARAWDMVDGQRSVSGIAEQLAQEFDVGAAEAREDLASFFADLQRIGALR